jgi:Ca-activated chloride channel family protein
MRAHDKVAIVTYAGEAGVALEPTSISDKTKILSAIEKLGAGGATYGSGGINVAYQIAEKMKVAGSVNRVVLATDGDFNVGLTSQDELQRLIEEKRKSGITLTTLGFGTGNIHDDTMELLANKGNGNYFYIDSFKEARKVLETDLVGTMEVIAKDVKLQIEFNPSKVAAYRLIGYENRKLANEDFKNDKVDAGEIGSGHTVTALYELVMRNSDFEKALKSDSRYQPVKDAAVTNDLNEVGFLKVRFKVPEGDTSKEMSFPIDPAQTKKSVSDESTDFKFASAVAYFGEVLRESPFADNLSLSEIANLAESARGEDTFGYRREFVEIVKNARAVKK